MKGMFVDDTMSNLTSASNEANLSSSSNWNETGSTMYPPQPFASVPNNQIQPTKKKRNLPGNPDPEAEVIALSPRALMATNRFICDICNKGFQRDQNLQLHRRGHNLPWKLKQRANKDEVIRKKVYVCPETTCVHHDPSRALGDLTGIKKHFSRKHGEKKWKCQKCTKRYAVQSDWKAHSKICGTREYRCDCGTLFSRRDSFITHRAFCDALAEESARSSSTLIPPINHHQLQIPIIFPLKTEQDHLDFNIMRPDHHLPSSWLDKQNRIPNPNTDLSSSQLFSSSRLQQNPNPNNPTHFLSLPHMSATALLQKAAQMGVTMNKPTQSIFRPHQADHIYTHTAGSALGLSSTKEMGTGFANVSSGCMEQVGATTTHSLLYFDNMVSSNSLSSASGIEGSSFEEALNGMLNPKRVNGFQQALSQSAAAPPETILNRSKEGGGDGNDELTRDFLGLRGFPHDGDHFLNMGGLGHIGTSSPYDHQQNQNQAPWQD